MSKVKHQKNSNDGKPSVQPQAVNTRQWPDFGIVFIILYLLIEFLPAFQGIDVIGAQWLFLTVLNIVVVIFIFLKRNYYRESIKNIFNSYAVWAYLLLLIWALISYLYAVNSSEVLVNGARMASTVVAFINIIILLLGRKQNFSNAIHFITFILKSISIY